MPEGRGYPTGDLLARALEFSPVMLLAKPTSPARLIESVRMVLETPHPLPVCPATEWADSARRQLSVSSGEVKTCQGTGLLRASAIGSCVVVAALDPAAAVGGMAHVMLPGASGGGHIPRRWKYARDAVEQMLSSMAALGADAARARVCLVGGANVLGPAHVSPGPEIVESLTGILGGRDIPTVARAVGGTQRRSCTLDVATGCVTCTVGGSATRTLWQPGMDGAGPDRDRRPATREGTREVPT
ncbi:MAG: chemotaxis protein CheD [Planctomycetota bacterium]